MIWIARIAWLFAVLAALACALLGVLVPGVYRSIGGTETEGMLLFGTLGVVGATYATSGLLILRQRPRHIVGWLLLAAGAVMPAEFLAFAIGLRQSQLGDPTGTWLVLLAGALFWPMLILAGPAITLFFPDGRLPSPGWRWPIRIGAGVLSLVVLAFLVRPGSVDREQGLPDNPIGLALIPEPVFSVLESTGFVVAIATVAVAIGSVVVRMRRGTREERLQLRWFLFAVVVWCLLLPLSLFSEGAVLFTLALGALAFIPIAILIAITRYRLYEIDTLINRTLVYVPLVGIVAGLYAASVALLQRVSVAITGDTSDAAAIISALVLAAIFTPIRKWLEGIVDKRFKPASATAEATAPTVSADDPVFVAAVETVVRRVLADGSAQPRRTRAPAARKRQATAQSAEQSD